MVVGVNGIGVCGKSIMAIEAHCIFVRIEAANIEIEKRGSLIKEATVARDRTGGRR